MSSGPAYCIFCEPLTNYTMILFYCFFSPLGRVNTHFISGRNASSSIALFGLGLHHGNA